MTDYKSPVLGQFEWQQPVLDKDLTAPPGGESKGDRYIVGASATGAWSGEDGNIATYNGSGWDFADKREGMYVFIKDEDLLYKYITSWTPAYVSLPNTIANVLSDHNVAAHNALGIIAYGLDVEDTRAAQRLPNEMPDKQVTAEFSDEIDGLGAWFSLINVKGWSDGYASWQLIGGSTSSTHENLYFRSGINATWNTLRKIWHEGIDKPHSGLTDVTANQHHPQSHTLVSHTSRDHHNLVGLGDDDHTIYLRASGVRALTGNWDAGGYQIRALKFYSDQATGTAPFTVLSTTKVGNLNVCRVDEIHGTSFLRSDVDDNLTAAIIVPTGNRDEGIFGTYDSVKTQHIWSMGTGYRNSPTGANFGNLYGLAYKYNGLAGGHGVYLVNNGVVKCGLGLNVWTSGRFISTIATGTAPFQVASTTMCANLNAQLLSGYAASVSAGNNTVVVRHASGYIYCNYLNCTSGATSSEPTHYFVETANDSFLRQMTPANFVAKLVADGLMPKSGGIFTGHAYAGDHGTAAEDMLINVCYGSGSPPAANSTTIGTLFIKYQP